jgi:hypothetical protein
MGIKIKDDKLRVSTNGPKKISFSPYNIRYLMGTNQEKKILNKSWKIKTNDLKDNKGSRYLNLLLRDKIEARKKTDNNLTETNTED